MYLIELGWVKKWVSFIKGKTDTIPDKIENGIIYRKHFVAK